jgi:hypothetical protein
MLQLSLAVGAVHVATAEHSPDVLFKLIIAGQLLMTGSSVSVTTTLNEHVAISPFTSVAVYVTVVVPTGNTSPLL